MLADERRSQGLKVADVAEKSGYSMDHLMKLECGHRTPSLSALNAWAGSLGFEVVLRKKGAGDGRD